MTVTRIVPLLPNRTNQSVTIDVLGRENRFDLIYNVTAGLFDCILLHNRMQEFYFVIVPFANLIYPYRYIITFFGLFAIAIDNSQTANLNIDTIGNSVSLVVIESFTSP